MAREGHKKTVSEDLRNCQKSIKITSLTRDKLRQLKFKQKKRLKAFIPGIKILQGELQKAEGTKTSEFSEFQIFVKKTF